MNKSKLVAKFKTFLVRSIGIAFGIAVMIFYLRGKSLQSTLLIFYEKVGITIIALIPLAVWAAVTALRAGRSSDVTLSYIATTAQRVGLLGTVIGIVAATIAIGDKLSSGAAEAVTGALPAVGQALVSTAIGFVIAIICDFFRYLDSIKSDENTEE